MKPNKTEITTSGDREIQFARTFNGPKQMVFDALTRPELVKRWLLGPPGWTMPVCEIDLRVGGKYRYVWESEKDGTRMGMGGVYREVARPDRLVNTEKFDEAWYPGEALITTTLRELDGITHFRCTIEYESKEARDQVLKSDMEKGVDASYHRLDEILSEQSATAGR